MELIRYATIRVPASLRMLVTYRLWPACILLTYINLCMLLIAPACAAEGGSPMWHSSSVQVRSVLPMSENRHSIHSYFNANPESPDGRFVLYFSSAANDASKGTICIIERTTGKETVLATISMTEDAHRAACQQWVDGGRSIAFHDYQNGHWRIFTTDITTGKTKELVQDRQLGFGSPTSPEIPIYGCHWNPGPHRNLELLNVNTGVARIAVNIDKVVSLYGEWIQKTLGGRDVSVFFPVMSPDANRVFFKIALGRGGNDWKGMDASKREGKVIYDLKTDTFLGLLEKWGHPSWSPDSGGILEKGNFVYNVLTRQTAQLAARPAGELPTPSDHPSFSPNGKLFVTDANITKRPDSRPGEWAIVVAPATQNGNYEYIARFVHSGGAQSWRTVHPHPVFSADSKRIYFNASSGGWSRLHVAEICDPNMKQ